MAVTGVLTCWLPLIGPVFAAWAWFLNRNEPDWRRPASGYALIIAVLIHMLIGGMLLVEAIGKM